MNNGYDYTGAVNDDSPVFLSKQIASNEGSMTAKDDSADVTSCLVTNLIAAWNAHDIERAVVLYTSDYTGIDVSEAGAQQGPEGIRQSMARYLEAFPDLRLTQETTLLQGDQVAITWTVQGTHQGRLMNIPPTGRSIQVQGVSILTLKGGQICQGFYIWDVAGLLRNLGLLPEL